MIRLRALGPTELRGPDGRELRSILAQPKRLALLTYLAARPGVYHRRDTLVAMFWPELDEVHARAALSQALRFLRKALGNDSAIQNRGVEELSIDRAALWCDAAMFRDAMEAGRFAEALELYTGDLLAGFFAESAAGFEEWLDRERADLRTSAAKAARALAEQREGEERLTTAVVNARRAIELSDLDERLVRELLELLDRLGDRAGALHAYAEFERRLQAEYDAAPADETQRLMQRIRSRKAVATPEISARERMVPDHDGLLGADLNGYGIERELGRGGMSTVYLARDKKHDRHLALKVMRADLAGTILGSERFLREIQIMARLTHPHILPLIDSGAADGALYLVTPYVSGESLRDRLHRLGSMPLDFALGLIRQVASALEYAHRHGVIHRDIKPANILLQDEQAVVADFGIALAVQAASGKSLSEAGFTPGTPPYISPEQALGSANIDTRTDVYSLGAVLYEMLLGATLPTDVSADDAYTRLSRVGVPAHVCAAVGKALAPVPSDRFSSVSAFAAALSPPGVAATIASPPLAAAEDKRPTVVVLPLTNMSATEDEEFFSDGVTEDIIAQLSLIRGLKVISRTSAMRYKGSKQRLDEIARELRASHVVEGSIRRAGNRLRIVTQLIDVQRDEHLWAETFDRELSDVFAVQSQVAQKIAEVLKSRLTHDERIRLTKSATRDIGAYTLFLRGRQAALAPSLTGGDPFVEAAAYYQAAVDRDPNFAAAYAALAFLHSYNAGGYWGVRPKPAWPRAHELARRALAIDDTISDAYVVLHMHAEWVLHDWHLAEHYIDRALDLNPSNAIAWINRASINVVIGEPDYAVQCVRQCIELDPYSPLLRFNALFFLWAARRFDEALAEADAAEALFPVNHQVRTWQAWMLLSLGRDNEAALLLESIEQLAMDDLGGLMFAAGLAACGKTEKALARLAEYHAREKTGYVFRTGIAIVYTHLGNCDRALEYLEKAYEEREGFIIWAGMLPAFDPLRGDPRFQRFLERLGTPGRDESAGSVTVTPEPLPVVQTTNVAQPALTSALSNRPATLWRALLMYAAAFIGMTALAKAATQVIGLPDWVFPGAIAVMLLVLPVILFTGYVHEAARHALTVAPALTRAGVPKPQGTMATLAIKASPHMSWRRTSRVGIYAVGAFALLIVAFMVMRALGIGPAGSLLASGKLAIRERLLITDFTARGVDTNVAIVAAEGVRANLSQSASVTLMSPAAVARALRRMERAPSSRVDLSLARQLAAREGVKAIVDGDVTGLGGGFVVALRLVTADSGNVLASYQTTVAGPKDLIAGIDEVSRKLRGKIGESMRSVQASPPLARVTTSSLEALKLYTDGSRAQEMSGDDKTAIVLFRRAVVVDSDFAMAWRKLAVALRNRAEPYPVIDSAIDHAFRLRSRFGDEERYLTEAFYYSGGPGGDRRKAIAAYQALLDLGDSSVALNNLGKMYATLLQPARAETLYRLAIRLEPALLQAKLNLTETLANQGRIAEAYTLGVELSRQLPTNAAVNDRLMQVDLLKGDTSRALRIADSVLALGDSPIRRLALSLRGNHAMLHGKLRSAESYFSRSDTASQANPVIAVGDRSRLAFIDAWIRRDTARALRRIDTIVAMPTFTSLPLTAAVRASIASLYAQAGRPDRARAMLGQSLATLTDSVWIKRAIFAVHMAMAEIALAENRPEDAIAHARAANARPDGPIEDYALFVLVGLARAFDRGGYSDSAIVYSEKFISMPRYGRFEIDARYLPLVYKRLGELYDAKGDRARAASNYAKFVGLWAHSDPELQPMVLDVRRRLARLKQ